MQQKYRDRQHPPWTLRVSPSLAVGGSRRVGGVRCWSLGYHSRSSITSLPQLLQYFLKITLHLCTRATEDAYAVPFDQLLPGLIVFRYVLPIMDWTVDFHCQMLFVAVEINNARSDGMLTQKPEAIQLTLSKRFPEDLFASSRRLTQPPGNEAYRLRVGMWMELFMRHHGNIRRTPTEYHPPWSASPDAPSLTEGGSRRLVNRRMAERPQGLQPAGLA